MAERIAEKKKRVVITGIGVISPNGIGKEAFWEALRTGKSGIKKITSFDASSFPCRIAGEVTGLRVSDYLEKKEAKRMARFSQLATVAAKMALADAGLDLNFPSFVRLGITLGVSTSALDLIEKEHKILLEKGPSFVNPYGIFSASPHAAAANISKLINAPGIQQTFANECTGGLDAIGFTFEKIKSGQITLGVCGGVDAPITPLLWGGFCQGGLVPSITDNPEGASRPFDLKRTVGIISEGAAIFVLEEMEWAIQRKAVIYNEIIGFASNSDNHLDEGMKEAMEKALFQAFVSPSEIDYISAHGPSHVLIDKVETNAIKKLFGQEAYRIPISSIKSMIGNPLAAGGPLQVAALPLTFQEGIIPPTINYQYPDPECDLDYVPNKPRYNNVKMALVNSHGIAGGNASLLLKKCRI
jgi:3-oxoacyl-[acyl-carrier-protein] synthase II